MYPNHLLDCMLNKLCYISVLILCNAISLYFFLTDKP